jgi:drug/metabolite transporter (DMT)-like permease
MKLDPVDLTSRPQRLFLADLGALEEELAHRELSGSLVAGGAYVVVGAVSFGAHTTAVKYGYTLGLAPLEVLGGEFVLAAVFFGISLLLNRSLVRLRRREIAKTIAWGLVGVGGTSVSLYLALAHVRVAVAVALLFQYLLWVFLLEFLFHRRRPRTAQWVAAGLIGTGAILASGVTEGGGLVSSPIGIAFGLISGICYGSFLFGNRELGGIGTPLQRSTIMAVPLASIMMVFALAGFPTLPAGNLFTLEVVGILALAALLGQILPLWCFSHGVPRVGAPVAGVLASIELPIASFVSLLVLHEALSPVRWLGIVAITLAVILANLQNPLRPRRSVE